MSAKVEQQCHHKPFGLSSLSEDADLHRLWLLHYPGYAQERCTECLGQECCVEGKLDSDLYSHSRFCTRSLQVGMHLDLF